MKNLLKTAVVTATFVASFAAIAAAAWFFPAIAADIPVKAERPAATYYFSWSGLYIGGYGMYGANFGQAVTTDVETPLNLSSIPHGAGIGAELGYLTDLRPFVIGVKADWAFANMTASGNVANVLSLSNATSYLGDVNAILGLPLTPDGRLLGYLTGGFAFGGAKPSLNVAGLAAAANDTSTGWDIGGGLRYMLPGDHLWIGIEGDYYKLGDKSIAATLADGTPLVTSTAKYDIFVQKVAIGWKF